MYICEKRMVWYFVKYEHNNRKHMMCTKLRITVIQKSSYLNSITILQRSNKQKLRSGSSHCQLLNKEKFTY